MEHIIKNMQLKINEALFCILMLLMVFFGFGTTYISSYFDYIDDIFLVIFMAIALIILIKNRSLQALNKDDKIIFILGCVLIFIGIIGNCISRYQTSIIAILVDILSFCKLFGTYLAGIIIFDQKKGDRYFDIAENLSKVILTIIALIAIFNQVFDWGLGETYSRYNLPIYTLGGHPTYAAAMNCLCISILLVNYSKNKKWIILGFILTVLTTRMKAIGYVVIMIMFLIFNKDKKEFSMKYIIVYGIIAAILAKDYITGYFLDTTASRGVALISSIKLAKRFFPIGSGFATFGTVGSTLSYSAAYVVLEISQRHGFMSTESSFVGDRRMGYTNWTIWNNWSNYYNCNALFSI